MNELWNPTYRLRPYYRNLGVVASVFLFIAWLGSVLAAIYNIDGSFARPMAFIALITFCLAPVALAGVWLILLYYRYRLTLNNQQVTQRIVYQFKEIALPAIEELGWGKLAIAGRVDLRSQDAKIRIDFNNFQKHEQTEIISFLRANIPVQSQTGWAEFEEEFITPSSAREQEKKAALRLIYICIYGAAIIFTAMWLAGLGDRCLAGALINLLVGTWLMFKNRRNQSDE